MKNVLGKDAKSFVAGVVSHLKKDKKGAAVSGKIGALLDSVTKRAQREGIAVVESAVALTAAEQQAITRALEKVLGRTITLKCVVVPSLLGGMRITVADWVVDTSLQHQLESIAQQVL